MRARSQTNPSSIKMQNACECRSAHAQTAFQWQDARMSAGRSSGYGCDYGGGRQLVAKATVATSERARPFERASERAGARLRAHSVAFAATNTFAAKSNQHNKTTSSSSSSSTMKTTWRLLCALARSRAIERKRRVQCARDEKEKSNASLRTAPKRVAVVVMAHLVCNECARACTRVKTDLTTTTTSELVTFHRHVHCLGSSFSLLSQKQRAERAQAQ